MPCTHVSDDDNDRVIEHQLTDGEAHDRKKMVRDVTRTRSELCTQLLDWLRRLPIDIVCKLKLKHD